MVRVASILRVRAGALLLIVTCAPLLVMPTAGCRTRLTGYRTVDYDSGPGRMERGVPVRLSRPEFVIRKKKKEDGTLLGWEVAVTYVTDERGVYWVDVDPALFHSNVLNLTFAGANGYEDYGPGALGKATHTVTDETAKTFDTIAQFAATALSLYALLEAETPTEGALAGGFLLAQTTDILAADAVLGDNLVQPSDQEEFEATLAGLDKATLDTLGLSHASQELLATNLDGQAGAITLSSTMAQLNDRGGRPLGLADAQTLEALRSAAKENDYHKRMDTALRELITAQWQKLRGTHKDLFDAKGLSPRRVEQLVLASQRQASGWPGFTEMIRAQLVLNNAAGSATWTSMEEGFRRVYFAHLAIAALKALAGKEEWRTLAVRRLNDALKDHERRLIGVQASGEVDDAYRNTERKLFLALRMQTEYRELRALETFLASVPYAPKGTKAAALYDYPPHAQTTARVTGRIDEMLAARKQVNKILGEFQKRLDAVIKKPAAAALASAPNPKSKNEPWLEGDYQRPVVIYGPNAPAPDCGCVSPTRDGATYVKTYLESCKDLDKLKDGEFVILLERGTPGRPYLPGLPTTDIKQMRGN